MASTAASVRVGDLKDPQQTWQGGVQQKITPKLKGTKRPSLKSRERKGKGTLPDIRSKKRTGALEQNLEVVGVNGRINAYESETNG